MHHSLPFHPVLGSSTPFLHLLSHMSYDPKKLHRSSKEPLGTAGARFFLQAGCPSCHPTNSVKALMEQNFIQVQKHTKEITFVYCSPYFAIKCLICSLNIDTAAITQSQTMDFSHTHNSVEVPLTESLAPS